MSGFFKKKTQQTRLTEKASSPFVLRLIGMVCILAMVLAACCGCTSADTAGAESSARLALEEIEALKVKNSAAQAELNALKEWKEAAQQQIDALNANNTASQQEINSLKATGQLSQQEIDTLKAASQEAQQEIDALKAADKVSQQEIDALKAVSQALQQEIDALKAAVLALQTDNTTVKAEIDALKADSEALQQEIAKLQELLEEGLQSDEPSGKIRIYIDQGHNPASYHNAGAVGNGLYEGDVTFTIGCALAQLLEADGRFEICLSRPTQSTVLGTDYESSLAARVQGAEDFGADYFISLHINSFTSDTAHGIEVYVKEEGSESYDFGSSLLQGLVGATELRNRNMKINPDLYVLKNATMPAALLEMGFISNPDDAALLESNPELFAQGIYNGILSYFDLTDANAPTN